MVNDRHSIEHLIQLHSLIGLSEKYFNLEKFDLNNALLDLLDDIEHKNITINYGLGEYPISILYPIEMPISVYLSYWLSNIPRDIYLNHQLQKSPSM